MLAVCADIPMHAVAMQKILTGHLQLASYHITNPSKDLCTALWEEELHYSIVTPVIVFWPPILNIVTTISTVKTNN